MNREYYINKYIYIYKIKIIVSAPPNPLKGWGGLEE